MRLGGEVSTRAFGYQLGMRPPLHARVSFHDSDLRVFNITDLPQVEPDCARH
jgi:hypothetical protein